MSDRWMKMVEDPEPWTAPCPLPGPITTPRLILRLYEKGDGPAVHAAVDRGRSGLLPWMVWALVDHLTVDDSIHYVEKNRRAAEKPDCTNFPFGVFDRKTGACLGGTGLHRISPGRHQAEVGYWISGDRHGRGICTEAAGALISSALTARSDGGWGFRRIVVYNAADNIGSRRVCEKLGLRLESRERQDSYLERPDNPAATGYYDSYGFAVLKDEWDFENHRAKPGIDW